MERAKTWIVKHDQSLFYLLNQQPLLLIQFFKWITHLGGARVTIAVPLILLAVGPLELRLVCLVALGSLVISHVIVQLTKRVFRRIRPYLSIPKATVHGFLFKDHSFPSGHSTAVFAIVTPFAIYDSFLAPILLVMAFTVAVSRVVLGVHYPSDVAAGSILGALTAFLGCLLFY